MSLSSVSRTALIAGCRGFVRAETGSMTVFAMSMLIMMLFIGGIAVDVMRYENARTIMQNAMDRGALAAADLDQTEDSQTVAEDYIAKAGLPDENYDVQVEEEFIGDTLVGRRVSATANYDVDTLFMHMLGIEELPIAAASAAEEGINDIEISLVLDVSGSMGANNKLENMQDAAEDFIDTVFGNSVDGRIMLSVVPYSSQVNIGETLFDELTTQHDHDYSYCVDFPGNSYSTAAVDPVNDTLSQAGHFDPWTRYDSGVTPRNRVCRTDSEFEVTPWSRNTTALKNQINALEASGNTSIDIAMKWGVALLDPAMQPVLTDLTLGSSPAVDPVFVGRPAAYNNSNSIKIAVVMTDGINTTEYRLNDAFKRGNSGTWYDPDSRRYSLPLEEYRDTDGDNDWWEDWWYARNYGEGSYGRYWIDNAYDVNDDNDGRPEGPYDQVNKNDAAFQLTWPQLWNQMSLSHRAYEHFYRQYGNSNHYYNNLYAPYSTVDDATKDDRLDRICTAAKSRGIIVFSVGFEVTDDSAAVMRSCASSPSHFYRVEGIDISIAFASIANQINQLKLTQ